MSLNNLQQVNCPSCNNNNCKQQHIVKKWCIVKCNNCNLVYTNPRLSDNAVKNIYEKNYFHNNDYGYSNYNDNPHLKANNFAKWINEALPFLEKKTNLRALDVGCAAGFSFKAFEQNNITVDGIEIDHNYVNELTNKGFTVFNKPLLENKYFHQYDIITLFDVVEHLTNLDENFSCLNNLLFHKGIAVIVTPDYASIQRKIFGKRWFQFKPMEHINYFTLNTLNEIALRNGFELIHYKRSGQYADANFVIARLQKYNFKLAKIVLMPIIGLLRIFKKNIYLDSASFYAIYQKK